VSVMQRERIKGVVDNNKKNDKNNEMMCNEKSATKDRQIMKINQEHTHIEEEERQRENIGEG
jgi:hypothetical protein